MRFPERMVVVVLTTLIEPDDREDWRQAVAKYVGDALESGANGRVIRSVLMDNNVHAFLEVADIDLASRQIEQGLERSAWGQSPFLVGRWDGTHYQGMGPTSGPMANLARDDIRRFSVPDEGSRYHCGHTRDGSPVLMGIRDPLAVAYVFDTEGHLSSRRRVVGGHSTLATWRQELGVVPGAISIAMFRDLESGVALFDRPWELDDRGEDFCFYFGVELTNGIRPRDGAVHFHGPVTSSGDRVAIPCEPDGGRFERIGCTNEHSVDLQVFFNVTCAARDPAERERWYGVIHLFDLDGNHAQTVTLLADTSARARTYVNRVLANVMLRYGDLLVRRFSFVHDGCLFGLVDAEDHTVLWPDGVRL